MKYVDEFRARAAAEGLARRIAQEVTRPWVLMEVCGGQTHSIVRYGIDELLPRDVELVHGPGCPVCVTPLEMIDRALSIAALPGVIFTSYGDMLRVPGSHGDLQSRNARGADVRVVYSPLDALALARQEPDREVVFFGIGFETTAPANAMAVYQARRQGLRNFSMLASHVLVPPAVSAIFDAPDNRIQALLGPGHVCTVMGFREYERLVERHGIPIVITGFEPLDLLEGILRSVRQLEAGRATLDNQYARSVTRDGSRAAQDVVAEVFEVCDRSWRGIGEIASSGYRIRDAYREFDALHRFEVEAIAPRESSSCIAGRILRGVSKPLDCPAFGSTCTPAQPLGATMVSSEGACAAYYLHGRRPGPLVPAASLVNGGAT